MQLRRDGDGWLGSDDSHISTTTCRASRSESRSLKPVAVVACTGAFTRGKARLPKVSNQVCAPAPSLVLTVRLHLSELLLGGCFHPRCLPWSTHRNDTRDTGDVSSVIQQEAVGGLAVAPGSTRLLVIPCGIEGERLKVDRGGQGTTQVERVTSREYQRQVQPRCADNTETRGEYARSSAATAPSLHPVTHLPQTWPA